MRLERWISDVLFDIYWSISFATRMESAWYGVYHSFRGVVHGCEIIKLFIYDGDGISEWYQIISCSGKSWVYIWWLIVITYQVFKSYQLYLRLLVGGIVRSGKSWVLDIDKSPCKSTALQGGHLVFLVEGEYWLVRWRGEITSRKSTALQGGHLVFLAGLEEWLVG